MNKQIEQLCALELDGISGGIIDTRYAFGRGFACIEKGKVSLAYLPSHGGRSRSAVVDATAMKQMLSQNYSAKDIDGFLSKMEYGEVQELSNTEKSMLDNVMQTYVF